MPQILQAGSVNQLALGAPKAIVAIQTPTKPLVGVETGILGLSGVASWGPVGVALPVGGNDEQNLNFGPVTNRKYDLSTAVAVAIQQFCNNMKCVRVSDGTDVAASGTYTVTAVIQLTLTALYTGIIGNGITGTLQPGTASGTTALLVNRPGFLSEKFDNLSGSGNALWVAIANAVNNGQSALRGPSQLVVATAGSGTAVGPSTPATITLTSGTDGLSGVTDATILGTDTAPRKGLYALRNQGVSVACPVDDTTSSQWTTWATLGLGEGFEIVGAGAAGDTLSAAATELSGAGLDSYGVRICFGDWIYWWDDVNQVQRLLSPATFVAAMRAALSPEQSTLNKQAFGIIGSQKTLSGGVWSDADKDALYSDRLELLCNPVPGGSYWGCNNGVNSSSNAAINGDNYTQMTNFLARSVNAWGGSNVGKLQDPDQRLDARATIDAFFAGLWDAGMIGNSDSSRGNGSPPWSVQIDDTTTPARLANLGYEIAAVRVQYLSVIRWFIVNLMGGQTVTVTVSNQPPAFVGQQPQ